MHPDFFKKIEPLVQLAELIIPYIENGRLESLVAKAALVLDFYITQHKELVPFSMDEPVEMAAHKTPNPFIIKDRMPDPEVWLAPKQAWNLLGIKRSAFYKRLRKGDLKVYHLKGSELQTLPRVWLSRREVEAYGKTHFPNQGKGRRNKPNEE